MYRQWVLTALLAWPAVAAFVVMVAPARWAKHLALAASLVEFAISVPLWWTFAPAGGFQFILDASWIPSWGIRYTVGVDGISLFMVLLTTFLVPLSVLGSYAYITTRERGFYALMLVLTTGMIGVFVALDLFLFYVMWEVMLIPMYFIIGVWGGERRLYAAIKFFVYTFFGSLLMLVAILALVYLVAQRTGVYSFAYTHLTSHIGGLGPLAFWLFGAFFLAFAIKVPMFPFHTWLPDAHVEAPTAGSVLLAGVLLKMGTYGFLRFALPLFPAVALHPAVQYAIVGLSLIGILYGGLVAMVQPDFKKLIAYSSVAHLGFVMLGIWALTLQSVQGALLVMINHGISTGALFFMAGMLYERRHSRLVEAFGGIARVVPLLAAVLTIAWRHRTAADVRLAGWVTLAGLAAAGGAAWWLWWHTARAIGVPAMIAVDDFRFVTDWLLLGTAGLTVLVSFDYLERERLLVPEYFALLLFATLGMMLLVGLALLLVGFGFKVAAVPFHMWAPDVYDGSPTPVTGYMATAVKAAAFATLLRVLGEAFGGVPVWHQIVWWLAVATMVVGNLVALAQRTVKRMLAYSSIAHAGYLLVAVAAGTSAGSAAFLFYLIAYTLTTLAAFALLAAKGREGERDVLIDDLAGLGTRRPWLAFALAVCMLSEPFEQAHAGMRIGRWAGAAVAVSVAGLLLLGIRPNRLLDLAKTSGDGLGVAPGATAAAPPLQTSTGR